MDDFVDVIVVLSQNKLVWSHCSGFLANQLGWSDHEAQGLSLARTILLMFSQNWLTMVPELLIDGVLDGRERSCPNAPL